MYTHDISKTAKPFARYPSAYVYVCLMFMPTLVLQDTVSAEERTLWPSPRVQQGHPLDKAVPNTGGSSPSGGTKRHDNTPGSHHLRQSAASDDNRNRGRPLSRDRDGAGRIIIGNDGDGGAARSDTNHTRSSMLAAAAGNKAAEVSANLSGPNEPIRPQCTNDDDISDGPTGIPSAIRNLQDQRQPSAVAAEAHRASKSDRHPGPDEAAGVKGERGAKSISWGAPSDDAFRNNSRHRLGRGEGDRNPNPRRDDAQKKEAPGGGGHSTVSGERNDHGRFAREQRPGDRYYLPPPPRSSRPRKFSDETDSISTPRQSDPRRNNLHQRPSEPSVGEKHQNRSSSGRRGGGGGDNTNPPWSSGKYQRRERRNGSSSDRIYGQQPDDYRPMPGAPEASGTSHMPEWRYGWRGSSNATPSTLSQEDESLPYYVDRKQVCVRSGNKRSKVLSVQCHGDSFRVVLSRVAHTFSAAVRCVL